MRKGLLERLEAHPELKKHTEGLLDIAENTTGAIKKVDDAEIRVVDHMRKMGAALLHERACHEEKMTTEL